MSGAQGSGDAPVSCSTSQPRPRRRPPPRLRTKTGCLTCRKRRKKCDERKPLCQTCERLELDCSWEDADHQLVDRRFSTHVVARQSPNPLAPPPKQLSGLSPFASTHDQSLFSFFKTNILPSLMRKHVHPAYFDQAPLYSIAYSCPWLMNAILALSSHHLSWLQSKNGDPAVPYYAKAVRDLRKNMSSMSPDDDSLLSTITFLGLYEELRSDNFSHHMVHFNTSSQILKARMGELQQRRDANSIFLRIHAESAMYHLSTRALFAESLPTERDWAQLQQYLSTHPPSGAAEWTESPLLGSIPHLFTLILETTRLSRSAPLNDALMEKAAGYLSEIREANLRLASFRSRIAASHDSSPDPTLALEVHCIPALYLLALEMLLLKITRPATTRADSPDIQERADSAHALFHTPPFRPVLDAMRAGPDPTFPFTESNCWPLLVIGCATTRGEHVKALKAVLLNLWEVRYSGFVGRVIRVVDAAWKANRACCGSGDAMFEETWESASTAPLPMDGLDVLLRGRGSGRGVFGGQLRRGVAPESRDAFAVMQDWRRELGRPELGS